MNLRIALLTTTLLLFTACGGGGSNNSSFAPYLHKLLLTEYYWSSDVNTTVDYSQYNTPQEMINSLKKQNLDRWSFVLTKKEFSNFLNQKSHGFGFGYIINSNSDIQVYAVRIDSPADKAGLKRGDIIKEINENLATQTLLREASSSLGKTTSFTIYRGHTEERVNISITSQNYKFLVTKASMVKSEANNSVGYMRYDAFTDDSTTEINKAFNYFKENNASELVIDLRYNHGGSVTTASILLDKLIRDKDEKVQFTLTWNENYKHKNSLYTFETDDNSLNFNKIIFLTTANSASASELIISAMKPYMGENIITIGSATNGKPVGMSGKTDGTYYYFLINFVVKNANGFYDYFNGLPVTAGCEIIDDMSHEMGDKEESMLKAALLYVDTGSCK